MSQETFCCEIWCRLFHVRHYNNADQWPTEKLEWPKKERIKTGKLPGSFMLLFHISDIKDFKVPRHATVNALVLGLFLWRKKKQFFFIITHFGYGRLFSEWKWHVPSMVCYKDYFDIRQTTIVTILKEKIKNVWQIVQTAWNRYYSIVLSIVSWHYTCPEHTFPNGIDWPDLCWETSVSKLTLL